jgi:hypothetical protein
VTITLLQHTDPSLPHYTSETWTFVRGASATIDRSRFRMYRAPYYILHGIIEKLTSCITTSVSTIPVLPRRKGATEAIRRVMGASSLSRGESWWGHSVFSEESVGETSRCVDGWSSRPLGQRGCRDECCSTAIALVAVLIQNARASCSLPCISGNHGL